MTPGKNSGRAAPLLLSFLTVEAAAVMPLSTDKKHRNYERLTLITPKI